MIFSWLNLGYCLNKLDKRSSMPIRSVPLKTVFYKASRKFNIDWARKFIKVCYRWPFNETPVKKKSGSLWTNDMGNCSRNRLYIYFDIRVIKQLILNVHVPLLIVCKVDLGLMGRVKTNVHALQALSQWMPLTVYKVEIKLK